MRMQRKIYTASSKNGTESGGAKILQSNFIY